MPTFAPLDVFTESLFAGRVALVTGGGTGIGRETALGFARYGADVVLAGRTAGTLQATADEVAALGGRSLVVPTNIRDPEQVDVLRDRALERFGKVDFLVNNAGGQFPALPTQISDNGWRAVVDLNLNGTWNVISRFLRPMTDAHFGAIVNVVHIFSFERGAPPFVHSGAARAGVVNMTKTLAPYLGKKGVTINAFAPGTIETPGMADNEASAMGRTSESMLGEAQAITGGSSHTRWGTAEEMAAIMLFLCSPAARFVNGASIVADGAASQMNWIDFFEPDAI